MTYIVKPLSFEPTKLEGLSEKLIVSHWENNYGGAVRRLNAITAQLAGLDVTKASPGVSRAGSRRTGSHRASTRLGQGATPARCTPTTWPR